MSSGSTSSGNPWIWSEEHQRYYRYEYYSDGTYQRDEDGRPKVIWQPISSSSLDAQTVSLVPQSQTINNTAPPQIVYSPPLQGTAYGGQPPQQASGYGYHDPQTKDYGYPQQTTDGPRTNAQPREKRVDSMASIPNMPPPAPPEIRAKIKFPGTPERGWYEPFDNRYRVRTSSEEFEFFKPGRVFAMLWAETAGHTLKKRTATENSNFTILPNSPIVKGSYGEDIYCQIRRFVIVRVNRNAHFVEACAITTYGKRGVLKPGCNASEHTIVYLKGTRPESCYLNGEYEKGMTKSPIAIEPAEPSETMLPSSRLRLGKIYAIECNVKVRDIGKVAIEDKTKLMRYYQLEKDNGFEVDGFDDDISEDTPAAAPGSWPAYQGSPGYSAYHGHQSYPSYQ